MKNKPQSYVVHVTATARETKPFMVMASSVEEAEQQALDIAARDVWSDFSVFSNADYEVSSIAEA